MSLLIFISSCENNNNLRNNNNLKEKGLNKSKQMEHIIYTCPMHPEIKQDKLGNCPICNMKLIPIKNTTKHPEHSDLNKENLEVDTIKIKKHFYNQEKTNHFHNLATDKSIDKLSFENTLKVDYNIKLYKVKYLTLKNEIKFNGYKAINESNMKSLSLNTEVLIKDTYNLFEGKYIRKGEPILKIYSFEIEQTKKELELVKDNPKLKEIVLKKLNYLRLTSHGYINSDNIIKSVYDCILLKKMVNTGDFVKPNQTIYTFIINPDIWIIAEIPVSYLKNIYLGKNVMIKTYDGQSFYSTIDYIFPNSNFENKTVKIRIKYPHNIKLPWNIPLELSLIDHKTALFIPIDSIINKGDKKIVFKKVYKNTFKPIYIKIGEYYNYEDEGYYEVIDGLKEGDEIAHSGVFLLDSESRIKGLY